MKLILSFVFLLPLIASCNIYQSAKAMKTLSDIDKEEPRLQREIEKEQKDIDRVSREIEELKKNTANK